MDITEQSAAPPAPHGGYTVYVEPVAVSADPRLHRSVHHDSRSRAFAYDTSELRKGTGIVSVVHARNIPILDQGRVGSCTGNAGIADLATDPMFAGLAGHVLTKSGYTLDQPGALRLYSAAQFLDGNGRYPPNDRGSNGLSIAKALKTAGLISSYRHTFTRDDALLAASQHPFISGMNWYTQMFHPDVDGRVRLSGALAGGHEVMCREIDAPNQRVWFDNSWGANWGAEGRFYLTFEDFGTLLQQRGDVTFLMPAEPIVEPPPAPAPNPKPKPKPKPKPVVKRPAAPRAPGGTVVGPRPLKTPSSSSQRRVVPIISKTK